MNLVSVLHDSDFVLIDGVVCETEYSRVPDEFTMPDDVVLEAKHGDIEFAFICSDFDGAQQIGEGLYRLTTGRELRFLSAATVH